MRMVIAQVIVLGIMVDCLGLVTPLETLRCSSLRFCKDKHLCSRDALRRRVLFCGVLCGIRFEGVWELHMAAPQNDPYLEGQGDFVSRSITPIRHVATLLIPSMNLLTKSP